MGFGLFATEDIAFGETILIERPLVAIPKNIGVAFNISRTGLTADHWHTLCMDEGEKLLRLALERMNEEDQTLFRSLCNTSAENPGRRPLISILVCNAMNLELKDAPEAQSFGSGYVGIPRMGSRINNRWVFLTSMIKLTLSLIRLFSCSPNAVFDFEPESFCVLYTATRDIKAGEQIFLGYFPATATLAQRREGMARYRFICQCGPCANWTEDSDKLRITYNQRITNLVHRSITLGNTYPAQELLGTALGLKAELEAEGLDSEPRFSEVWIVLQTLYQRLGNVKEMKECQKRIERYSTFPGYQKALRQAQLGFKGMS